MKNVPRCLLAGMLAALSVTAWPQSLDQRVTFSRVAQPLGALATELTEKTGVPIRVDRTLAREVVVVQVRDVPLIDLLRRIAEVSGGTLTRGAEGDVRLNLDQARDRREAREHLDQGAENIRRMLRIWEDELEEQRRAAERGHGAPPFTADVLAIKQLGLLMRPETLAEIAPGERMVFSLTPNRSQRPLGQPAERILAEHHAALRAERAQLLTELAPSDASPSGRAWDSAMRMGLMAAPNPMTEPVAEALFVATRGSMVTFAGFEATLRFELRLYDRAGGVMHEKTLTLAQNPPEPPPGVPVTQGVPGAPTTAPGAGVATPIRLSPLAQEKQSFFATMHGPGRMSPSPELLNALRQPDLVDPHALLASEATMALAANQGVQLVANFPDTFVPLAVGFDAPQVAITTARWARTLETSDELTLTTEGGWMLVQPKLQAEARDRRVDRAALATLIRAAEEKVLLGVEDWSAFAASSPDHVWPADQFRPSVEHLYFGYWGAAPPARSHWLVLRLYGLLSESQLRLLETNQVVPFRTMDQRQRDVLKLLLFGGEGRLRVRETNPFRERFAPYLTMFLPTDGPRTIQEEATEAMPDGLPADGFLHLVVEQAAILVPFAPDGSPQRQGRVRDALQHANLETLPARSGIPDIVERMGPFNHVKVGNRRILRLRILASEHAYLEAKLHDDELPRDAQVISVDNLPAEFVEAVRQHRQTIEWLHSQLGALRSFRRPGDGTP